MTIKAGGKLTVVPRLNDNMVYNPYAVGHNGYYHYEMNLKLKGNNEQKTEVESYVYADTYVHYSPSQRHNYYSHDMRDLSTVGGVPVQYDPPVNARRDHTHRTFSLENISDERAKMKAIEYLNDLESNKFYYSRLNWSEHTINHGK
jgi:hypothetical protein